MGYTKIMLAAILLILSCVPGQVAEIDYAPCNGFSAQGSCLLIFAHCQPTAGYGLPVNCDDGYNFIGWETRDGCGLTRTVCGKAGYVSYGPSYECSCVH